MLKIEKNIFARNLSLTQEYCRMQLDKEQRDNAQVFRSYNPTLNDKPLFSFKVEYFDFDIEPNLNSCTLTEWALDPTERENGHLIDRLFEQQIKFKESQVSIDNSKAFQGDILISQIDCTVVDGASEVQSLGLIDIYDIPPIDTWFYFTTSKESRLLFTWIPKELRHYADSAVLVNCVECINWFQNFYPKEYEDIIANTRHCIAKSGAM